MQDLKLVSDKELIDEILGRYDNAIFAGIKFDIGAKGMNYTRRRWRGNLATCAGLCLESGYMICRTADEEGRPVTEEPGG